MAPAQVRLGGLKSPGSAWLEVNLVGELAGLGLGANDRSRGLEGRLGGLIQGRQNADGWDVGARLQVHDLTRPGEQGKGQLLAEESTASVRARVARKLDRIDFSELAIVTPYGRIEGSGPVTDLRGAPSFDLRGTFSPDWKALSERLARDVEPNASIAGSPRDWRLAGTLPREAGKDLLGSISGEFGINLEHVDIFGMRLGRTALVVRGEKGKVLIDPIDSTLNSGRLHLEPEVTRDKQGLAWIHLGSSSGLLDAVVNDEVSHRVLSFVAPVLDQATRVRGRVSLAPE